VAGSERGICRVVCFSPRHDLTLGQMDHGAIRRVVDTWTDLRVPKTCAIWAKALQSAVERSVCAGPVLGRPEVG
jgi:UDPglucose--hexose-1-phosphate uridylyltransferase